MIVHIQLWAFVLRNMIYIILLHMLSLSLSVCVTTSAKLFNTLFDVEFALEYDPLIGY